ncbi:hypothetical protein HGRIS_012948 [Hohenbuehelia grisea]|uniref:Copper radical oxidase n=1 Tax=Hohenbuehelia grisea TaxID=104357 RepID=A0ABR3ITV6_9AGAR
MVSLTFFFTLLRYTTLVSFVLGTSARNSAWNGHTTPGSTRVAAFTPYYVPPGAKSYDSASPLIHYSGKWIDSYSSGYAYHTLRSTSAVNASVSFTFTGTGIEWFGCTSNNHGQASVYVDGKLVRMVNAWSKAPLRQQRMFWVFGLPFRSHTIRIVNNAPKETNREIVRGISARSRGGVMDLDAFVVTQAGSSKTPRRADLTSLQVPSHEKWGLVQKGSTGVHAMQLAVVSETHALIVDKVEHNPLTLDGHPAWASLYNLNTHAVRPLRMLSNSFCAGGAFLGNGTLVNVGGNPVVEDRTAAAEFGDLDGLQSVRLFDPCDGDANESCSIYENHDRIRLASPRWYNTVLRISDGSAMIIGGAKKGGWINNATVNNPTLEYYPPKSIHGSDGLPIHLPFLVDTLNSNLFPMAFSLPDGNVFMAANRDAMIYNWRTNSERRLPRIPNGLRVTYPMTGSGLLLPLTPENNYTPEVLLCGGSTIDDTRPGYEISSQDVASAQCARMVLTDAGIAKGWQVEEMPQPRTMLDMVMLPTGQIVIVNGAGSGISGYGNVVNQVGASNADHPVLTPLVYDPSAAPGKRFSSKGMPSSDIPRLYHSVATLTPKGDVMIAGSNPNLDRSELMYGTEYRVEWLSPPYMAGQRPEIIGSRPRQLQFGRQVRLEVRTPTGLRNSTVKAALMDFGFVTHAVHANSRLVYLQAEYADGSLIVSGPPDGNVYPPGPAWLHILVDGIPSKGIKIIVGDGKGPAVDHKAIQNILQHTSPNQTKTSGASGEGEE